MWGIPVRQGRVDVLSTLLHWLLWPVLTFAGVTDCRKDVKSRLVFGSPHGFEYAKGLVWGHGPLW